MPAEQLEPLMALPSRLARVAAAHRVRERRVDEEHAFDGQRFAPLGVPTLLLAGGTARRSCNVHREPA